MLEQGDYKIHLENNIIFVELIGSFNEYAVKSSIIDVENLVKRLGSSPFALIIDCKALDGFTPEAYELLEEHN